MPTSPDEVQISWDVRLLDWIANELRIHGLVQSIEVLTDLSKATLKEVTANYATVIRTYVPEYDLEDTAETRITILPISIENDWLTRKKCIDTYEVHLICQRRLPMDEPSNTERRGDELRTILMQIHDYLGCKGFADLCDTQCRWQPSRQPVIWSMDDVQEKHLLNCGLATFWIAVYNRCRCDADFPCATA